MEAKHNLVMLDMDMAVDLDGLGKNQVAFVDAEVVACMDFAASEFE